MPPPELIPHTFGGHLNFNCHLHILVSEGGLREDGARWRKRASLDQDALMPMWRYAVITLLREAARAGVLDTDMTRRALRQLLTTQYERWWNTNIQRFRSKKQFLGYAGRYARRPPIAQHRFRKIDGQEIRFVTKDRSTGAGSRDHLYTGSVPGRPSRSHPRPLPAQHPVLRSARASRKERNPRRGLRAGGPGTAREASATTLGRIAKEKLRD